jgi:hypothetical protein
MPLKLSRSSLLDNGGADACGVIDSQNKRKVGRQLTFVKATVSTKSQLILPEIRHSDKIQVGEQFDIERIEEGEYLPRRKKRRRNVGLVKLLLAGPVKGWFKLLPRTENIKVNLLPEADHWNGPAADYYQLPGFRTGAPCAGRAV